MAPPSVLSRASGAATPVAPRSACASRPACPAAAQDGLASAASTAGDATRGALSILVESTAEPDPQPRVNEVTVAEVLSPRSAGCPSDAGCVQYRFAGRGLLMGARVVGARGRSVGAYVHDAVGHGVLGLCHIDARQVGGAENSLMSSGLGATRWLGRGNADRTGPRGDPCGLCLERQPRCWAVRVPRRSPRQPAGRAASPDPKAARAASGRRARGLRVRATRRRRRPAPPLAPHPYRPGTPRSRNAMPRAESVGRT